MQTLLKTFTSNQQNSSIELKFDYNREEESVTNVSVTFLKKDTNVDLTDVFEDDEELSAFLDDIIDRTIAKQ